MNVDLQGLVGHFQVFLFAWLFWVQPLSYIMWDTLLNTLTSKKQLSFWIIFFIKFLENKFDSFFHLQI